MSIKKHDTYSSPEVKKWAHADRHNNSKNSSMFKHCKACWESVDCPIMPIEGGCSRYVVGPSSTLNGHVFSKGVLAGACH